MTRTVFCKKLDAEELGLEFPPFPGDLGTEIYNNISKHAWQMWLSHQTMLINEYRLNMLEPEARQFLVDEMKKFLFGTGSDAPPGYQPPE
ncbi:MAG: oxidative damage protection protein [Gammaproteobacteria bacterium]|nr:oxidative damage protection protein [Gammaproteobacteria bacterium]